MRVGARGPSSEFNLRTPEWEHQDWHRPPEVMLMMHHIDRLPGKALSGHAYMCRGHIPPCMNNLGWGGGAAYRGMHLSTGGMRWSRLASLVL